jgi:hypothetical protein
MNLDYKIKRSIDFVYDHLTDMQKFVIVHPVIYKIDDLGNNRFLVFEKLKFGFIPLTFTYFATVDGNPATKKVIIKARVMKLVNIEMVYDIKEGNDHTIVNEVINFRSFLPVKPIMKKIFKEQHEQLFLNIEKGSK